MDKIKIGPTTRSKSKAKQIETAQVNPVQNMNKKVLNKNDRVVVSMKTTPTFTESFHGRLEWKKKHFKVPVTSTPVNGKNVNETKQKKPHTIIAYPDSPSKAESSFISPIPKLDRQPLTNIHKDSQPKLPQLPLLPQLEDHSKPPKTVVITQEEKPIKTFNSLLDKYGDDDELLHIPDDPKKIKTYQRKKPITSSKNFKINAESESFNNNDEDEGKEQRKPKRRTRSRKTMNQQKSIKNKSQKKESVYNLKCVEIESSKKVKKVHKNDPEIDPNANEWIRKTNKEFDEIMKFDLEVEKF